MPIQVYETEVHDLKTVFATVPFHDAMLHGDYYGGGSVVRALVGLVRGLRQHRALRLDCSYAF